jgi:predicted TIM-barrel fold metal-dependent hydrolase
MPDLLDDCIVCNLFYIISGDYSRRIERNKLESSGPLRLHPQRIAVIIDAHAHIFPCLQNAPGDGHLRFLQRGISGNQQPVRRSADNAVIPHRIWAEGDFSPAGYQEVDFRVGKYGRFEWTIDGTDYYKQFMPPSLQDNRCDPDYLIAEMDYAGVDRAVLQNDHFYGSLNDMFEAAVCRYPDRFIATAHIDELSIGEPAAIQALHDATERRGMRGIFYDRRSYWTGSSADAVDDAPFQSFWSNVERLGLVVYWVPGARIGSGTDGYLAQLERWLRLLDRFPDLKMVLPCGLPDSLLQAYPEQLPRQITDLARSGAVCFELCYPIVVGGAEEYPYAGALRNVRRLYDECGASALAWGSDVPNVLRYCTYRQSLTHITLHANFITSEDLDLILGGNLARFFGLTG